MDVGEANDAMLKLLLRPPVQADTAARAVPVGVDRDGSIKPLSELTPPGESQALRDRVARALQHLIVRG